MKDLFETPELIPANLKEVLEKHEDKAINGFSYEDLKEIQAEIKEIGYTFDYGLDAEPYNLRKT
jgi:hypothetical protein